MEHEKLRSKKESLTPTTAEASCSRAAGYFLRSKRRLVGSATRVRDVTPTAPSSRSRRSLIRDAAAQGDETFHPVLSLNEDLPPHMYKAQRMVGRKRSSKRAKRKPRGPVITLKIPKLDKTLEKQNAKRKGAPADEIIMDSCMAATHIEPLQFSEIQLPGFKVRESMVTSAPSTPAAEDTSTSAYQNRHTELEKIERQRLLSIVDAKRKATEVTPEEQTRKYARVNPVPQPAEVWPLRTFPLSDADCNVLMQEVKTEPSTQPMYKAVA